MSADHPSAPTPHGSCLVCGYDKPWVVWFVGDGIVPLIGVCEDCKRGADRERGRPV